MCESQAPENDVQNCCPGWPRPVKRREGSPCRTSGIWIYYDFDWFTEFLHNKAMFPNGEAVCRQAKKLCPDGMQPAILLTARDDPDCPEVHPHPSDHIIVLKLNDLRTLTPDAGVTLFGQRIKIDLLHVPLVDMSRQALATFIAAHLNPEALAILQQSERDRWRQLMALTTTTDRTRSQPASLSDVIETLNALDQIDAELMLALKSVLAKVDDAQSRVELLRVLTHNHPEGSANRANLLNALLGIIDEQKINADELLEFLTSRSAELLKSIAIGAKLVEYRKVLEQLRAMVDANVDSESKYQQLLGNNPWLFGSEYSEILSRRNWTRDDRLDFMLRRTADEYLEIVEIKTPISEPLFIYDQSHDTYYQCSSLSKVIAQCIRYIEQTEKNRNNIIADDHFDPLKIRARIVIGRDGDENAKAALRNLNSHLHGIEVLTFDQLIRIGERVISVFESDMAGSASSTNSPNMAKTPN